MVRGSERTTVFRDDRDRSIVVEAEPSLLEVVRSLHLNPLRAQGVPGLRALARYPWTGHSALRGAVPRPWQATAVLPITAKRRFLDEQPARS